MNRLELFLLVGVLAVCLACRTGREESSETFEDSVLVREVRIVRPESGTVSDPRDLLISEGTILRIESPGAIDPSRVAEVVEASGLFALPGLIDVHAHLGDGGLGRQSEEDREGALEQFVRYGVTTIFVPGGGGGNGEQLKAWRERCDSGELLCPDLYGSGALVTAPGGHPIGTLWDLPADADAGVVYSRGAEALGEDESVEPLIDRKVSLGVDAIKVVIEDGPGLWFPKPRLSRDKVEALTEAAHARGLPVFAHVSRLDHVLDGIAAGVDGIMHSSEDEIPGPTLDAMARRKIFYVATLSLYAGLFALDQGHVELEPYARTGVSPRAISSLQDLEPAQLNPGESEDWTKINAAIISNLERASSADVPLALGTDTNNPFVFPGYSVHQELVLMVEAGLTPARALEAATRGGASFLGRGASLGSIAPGFEADFLLLARNPLEDIRATRSIHRVFSDGRGRDGVFSEADL